MTHGMKNDALARLFESRFGPLSERSFAVRAEAPGRLELAGNHTDHQGGRVISAALDRYVRALAAPNGKREVHAYFDGFGEAALSLDEPGVFGPHEAERGSSKSLIRGMMAALARNGGQIEGFDMVVDHDLPVGAGLSSSAAFEMLVGAVLRALSGITDLDDDERLAMALQGAAVEHDYFGKSCGAQDQIASAFGGLVFMDFKSEPPRVERIPFDFAATGHVPVLVNSRVDHSLYPEDYERVPADMREVARFLGAERLVEVSEEEFFERRDAIREALGEDRLLRAEHFFGETERVLAQYDALNCGDFEFFLRLANGSGRSSERLLRNVVPTSASSDDAQALLPQHILELCAAALVDDGAWRIHGGGFGGSILALVPSDRAESFVRDMDRELGFDACMVVGIANEGAHAWREDTQ